MKKTLLLLAMLPFVFMACEKEEKDDKQTNEPNELIISDTTYNLKEAFLNTPWTSRGYTYYTLFFNSDGVSYDTANKRNALNGNGKIIQVSLKFRDTANLPTGSFADSAIDYIGTYQIDGYDWNDINEEWKTKTLIDIGRSGSNYTIKFSLTDSSNRKTSVKYTGLLKPCDLAR